MNINRPSTLRTIFNTVCLGFVLNVAFSTNVEAQSCHDNIEKEVAALIQKQVEKYQPEDVGKMLAIFNCATYQENEIKLVVLPKKDLTQYIMNEEIFLETDIDMGNPSSIQTHGNITYLSYSCNDKNSIFPSQKPTQKDSKIIQELVKEERISDKLHKELSLFDIALGAREPLIFTLTLDDSKKLVSYDNRKVTSFFNKDYDN